MGVSGRFQRMTATLRVGTSGFHYRHWRGDFYPEDLSSDGWLRHYAACFDTVEINNSFYQLPRATTFDTWRDTVPAGFCYALKFSRYGSHVKRLKHPRGVLRRFLGRAQRLKQSLGPILVQLPPTWAPHPDRLAAFLKEAPRRHRWVLEFRDRRWLCDEVFAILTAYGAALCVHDLIENHPRPVTTGWGTCASTAGGTVAAIRPSICPREPKRSRTTWRPGATSMSISTMTCTAMPCGTLWTSGDTF